ncbi:hypothetical protein F5Y18DRAFT_427561 [Xylariaceae sp. FL1019]|nr:hypothetical protein F5Y18DRAFT_427561 [Xylariaceae sp. FL1019]
MASSKSGKGVSLSRSGGGEGEASEESSTHSVMNSRGVQEKQSVDAINTKAASQAQSNAYPEWWLVVLVSNRHRIKEYDVRVKEDTGSVENWIHPDVVKRCELSSLEQACAVKFWIDMNGKTFKCDRCLTVTWYGRKESERTYEEIFYVSSPKAPIQMALGSSFVDKHGRIKEICADRPKAADARMYVAKAMTKEQERQLQANAIKHKKESDEVKAQRESQAGGSKRQNSSSHTKKDSKDSSSRTKK